MITYNVQPVVRSSERSEEFGWSTKEYRAEPQTGELYEPDRGKRTK